MVKNILYDCCHAINGEHLCFIGLKFSASFTRHSAFGRFESDIIYNDFQTEERRVRRHHNSQSWYQCHEGEYRMGISRFSLPPSLMGFGIGTVIWSEFFKNLPENVKERLIASGALSSVDAFTPLYNAEHKPVFHQVNGCFKPVMENQIERRNRFWKSMLLPVPGHTSVLTCDPKGNGAFKGFLKDPLDGSSKKIDLIPVPGKKDQRKTVA